MCMGPSRQYIGFCNHPETCPPLPDSVMVRVMGGGSFISHKFAMLMSHL